ncbi:MAG: hypothetical protein EA357_05965 [Micavibrio sp.]|nr:MAG: hypothetical protein EA357_05965 [Micavibrio sp.]
MAEDDNKQPEQPEKAPKEKGKSFLSRMKPDFSRLKPNLRLSERFNFKAMKRKAIIGGTVLAVGAGGVGGVLGAKHLYDNTEQTVQFYVESIDSKRTLVRESCHEVTTERHHAWRDPETAVNKSACDTEVLSRIIRTPQGVFANNPSTVNLKGMNEVETIDANIRPGAWYEAVVKGFNFRGPKNIMSVERLPNNWMEIREAREQGLELAPEFRDQARPPQQAGTPAAPGPVGNQPETREMSLEELQRQLEIMQLQRQLEELRNPQQQTEPVQPPQQPQPRNPAPPAP